MIDYVFDRLGVIIVITISLVYWYKLIKAEYMAKFKIGDYVCTMYEGQYVYGSILEYYQKKYYVLLDDGRKIKISESTWCVKRNPLKY